MTKGQVLKVLRTDPDAAIYVWHGEVYLDSGTEAQMIPASVFCALYRDGRGEIEPIDADNNVYQVKG